MSALSWQLRPKARQPFAKFQVRDTVNHYRIEKEIGDPVLPHFKLWRGLVSFNRAV